MHVDCFTLKSGNYSAPFNRKHAKGLIFQETHKSIHGAPEAIPGFKGS